MSEALEERQLVGGVQRPFRSDAVRVEATGRRVRAYFGGQLIADSKRALLAFEPRRLAQYWFPIADVRMGFLRPHQGAAGGDTARWDLEAGGRSAENAAWSYPDPDPERAALKDHIAFFWNRMDAWYEEDDEVFVHARDPYHRVDVLSSSRQVRVEVEGRVVAETGRPKLLFETGLPTRYYIPKLDVRMDLLEPTDTVTRCPYKGQASYWSVRVADRVLKDLVWGYPAPIPECPKIENLLCFYNEKVDIYVDGELQPRPTTQWS
ncbi:MAG: DUF427 domain-containing protein [Candidatus Dormibacteraeota bacterium]|nr:DUF427 domain-containing protein [Candidatus Dormibacteraeota bacterium]